MITLKQMEIAFGDVIERNRKGLTDTPCPRDALFSPAIFVEDCQYTGSSVVSGRLKLSDMLISNGIAQKFWIVTHYLGLVVAAFCEEDVYLGVNPDFLWYPRSVPGVPIRISPERAEHDIPMVVYSALNELDKLQSFELDSDVRDTINRGRARAKPQNRLPDLPHFIVLRPPSSGSRGGIGDGGTRQAHDRRGHKRRLRSGKVIDVRPSKIHGGSVVPRNYLLKGDR